MADLYLSGIVGRDITEEQVVDFLNNNDDQDLNIYINSPGGSVFAGLGIYNILKDSGRNITTINNGLAASMGSILFLAGDNRIANTGSLYMVHKPNGGAFGNADDMKKSAEVLDKIQASLAAIYKERAGIENIDDYINDETYWDVDDMLEKGIAHSTRKIETKEGDEQDMAKIDDLKAENEELAAEKAELQSQIDEAKLEAQNVAAQAEIEKLKAEAAAITAQTSETSESLSESESDTQSSETQSETAKADVIDTTNAVRVDAKNEVPAFMQTDFQY